jgi:hypothetical protein
MAMESKSIVPQWGEKRYNNINDDWRRRFGEKIGKVTLDAGFTCPNRDGTLSDQGCRFCSPAGSGDFVALPGATLAQQYERGREVISNKWPVRKYIAYLQSFTNTYAPANDYGKSINLYYLCRASSDWLLPRDLTAFRKRSWICWRKSTSSIICCLNWVCKPFMTAAPLP